MANDRAAWFERAVSPSGPMPRLTWRRQVVDAAIAVVLVLPAVDYVSDAPAADLGRPMGPLYLVAILSCVLLAVRRRFPLTVLWMMFGLTLPVVAQAPRITFYGCVIAAYAAAAYSPYRVPTLLSVTGLFWLAWEFTRDGMPTVPQHYVGSMVLAIVVLAGIALRLWRSRAEEGQLRLAAAELEKAEELRRAVESERARIARELHDVVTHNVSVMVIQAGAARRTLDASPADARQAMLAVEDAGRTAMAELRHVMGLLAPSGTPELAPQPGLDQLAALVGRVRDTGMAVDLAVTGTPRPVPAGEGLAAYRVVQEALTNAVKHVAGASARVRVHYGEAELQVEVTDTGGQATGATGSGRGLLGLRERLAVYGGTLRTGPLLTGGGYRVSAVIPLGTP